MPLAASFHHFSTQELVTCCCLSLKLCQWMAPFWPELSALRGWSSWCHAKMMRWFRGHHVQLHQLGRCEQRVAALHQGAVVQSEACRVDLSVWRCSCFESWSESILSKLCFLNVLQCWWKLCLYYPCETWVWWVHATQTHVYHIIIRRISICIYVHLYCIYSRRVQTIIVSLCIKGHICINALYPWYLRTRRFYVILPTDMCRATLYKSRWIVWWCWQEFFHQQCHYITHV